MTFAIANNTHQFWHAIKTRSRHEAHVRDQLLSKQFEVFLPVQTIPGRRKDRLRWIEQPLFPGYCFARFNIGTTLRILNSSGVVNIVSFGGRPARIADEEIENLRLLVKSKIPYDPCPHVREGDLVEVTDGPLRGIVGRLLSKDSNRALVSISVDLISRAIKIEVDARSVRPRSATATPTVRP